MQQDFLEYAGPKPVSIFSAILLVLSITLTPFHMLSSFVKIPVVVIDAAMQASIEVSYSNSLQLLGLDKIRADNAQYCLVASEINCNYLTHYKYFACYICAYTFLFATFKYLARLAKRHMCTMSFKNNMIQLLVIQGMIFRVYFFFNAQILNTLVFISQ